MTEILMWTRQISSGNPVHEAQDENAKTLISALVIYGRKAGERAKWTRERREIYLNMRRPQHLKNSRYFLFTRRTLQKR
jgi:hypothetical protein